MRRFVRVCVAVGTVLAVAVPAGSADDGGGGPKAKPGVTCGRTVFAARIVRVGVDALGVRPGDSETGRPLLVGLDSETVVKKGDVVAGRSALAVGKRARFLVRVCRSGDRRVITAKVITLPADPPAAGPTTTPPPSTEPNPAAAPEVCGQGEMDTVLVAVSATSITVRTSSGEGVKEWPIAVNGDTVVRKNDQEVAITALKAGDRVHVVLVRCPSGSVRALRIVFLRSGDAPA